MRIYTGDKKEGLKMYDILYDLISVRQGSQSVLVSTTFYNKTCFRITPFYFHLVIDILMASSIIGNHLKFSPGIGL